MEKKCFYCRFPIEEGQAFEKFKRKLFHTDPQPSPFKTCLENEKRHREVVTPKVKREIKRTLARADRGK